MTFQLADALVGAVYLLLDGGALLFILAGFLVLEYEPADSFVFICDSKSPPRGGKRSDPGNEVESPDRTFAIYKSHNRKFGIWILHIGD